MSMSIRDKRNVQYMSMSIRDKRNVHSQNGDKKCQCPKYMSMNNQEKDDKKCQFSKYMSMSIREKRIVHAPKWPKQQSLMTVCVTNNAVIIYIYTYMRCMVFSHATVLQWVSALGV